MAIIDANSCCRRIAVPNQTNVRNAVTANDFGGRLRFKPDSSGTSPRMTIWENETPSEISVLRSGPVAARCGNRDIQPRTEIAQPVLAAPQQIDIVIEPFVEVAFRAVVAVA